jgi:hypothetical protein
MFKRMENKNLGKPEGWERGVAFLKVPGLCSVENILDSNGKALDEDEPYDYNLLPNEGSMLVWV